MKRIIMLILACAMAATIAACGAKGETVDNGSASMFVQVEEGDYWKVYYHRDTKVMYVMTGPSASAGIGVFTMMVNADGTPMVYREKDIPRVAQ